MGAEGLAASLGSVPASRPDLWAPHTPQGPWLRVVAVAAGTTPSPVVRFVMASLFLQPPAPSIPSGQFHLLFLEASWVFQMMRNPSQGSRKSCLLSLCHVVLRDSVRLGGTSHSTEFCSPEPALVFLQALCLPLRQAEHAQPFSMQVICLILGNLMNISTENCFLSSLEM